MSATSGSTTPGSGPAPTPVPAPKPAPPPPSPGVKRIPVPTPTPSPTAKSAYFKAFCGHAWKIIWKMIRSQVIKVVIVIVVVLGLFLVATAVIAKYFTPEAHTMQLLQQKVKALENENKNLWTEQDVKEQGEKWRKKWNEEIAAKEEQYKKLLEEARKRDEKWMTMFEMVTLDDYDALKKERDNLQSELDAKSEAATTTPASVPIPSTSSTSTSQPPSPVPIAEPASNITPKRPSSTATPVVTKQKPSGNLTYTSDDSGHVTVTGESGSMSVQASGGTKVIDLGKTPNGKKERKDRDEWLDQVLDSNNVGNNVVKITDDTAALILGYQTASAMKKAGALNPSDEVLSHLQQKTTGKMLFRTLTYKGEPVSEDKQKFVPQGDGINQAGVMAKEFDAWWVAKKAAHQRQ